MSGKRGGGCLTGSEKPRSAGGKAKLREALLFLLWLVTLPFRLVWWVLVTMMP